MYCCFAALHSAVNHGAMCFSHLLGFFLAIIILLVITPAMTASAMRYSSMRSALWSLSSSNRFSIASNPVVNCGVDVCTRHAYALLL